MVGIFIFILGLFLGSFANVIIRRSPYGKSIVKPASHCPKCLVPLKWKDNIPLISFLVLGGRCRNCKTRISAQYPLVELLTGLYFFAAYICFGLSFSFFISLLLGFFLLVISFIDINLRIIPDILSRTLLAAGLVLSFVNPVVNHSILRSAGGAVLGGGLLYVIAVLGSKIYKKDVMGGGDIGLLAAGGSFLGIANVFAALLVACMTGGLTGLLLIIFKKKKRTDFIPFGPFIAIGILAVFFKNLL